MAHPAFGKRKPGESVPLPPNERRGREAGRLDEAVAAETEARFERLVERRGGGLAGVSVEEYERLRREARGEAQDAAYGKVEDADWTWSGEKRRFERRKPIGLLAALAGGVLVVLGMAASRGGAQWARCELGLSSRCPEAAAQIQPVRSVRF